MPRYPDHGRSRKGTMADEELTVLPDQHSYRSRTPEMENKYEPRTASPVRSENDVGFSFRGAATRIADDRNMGNVRNMPEYRLLPASVVEARPRQPPWRTDQREATHRSLQATSDNLYHPQLNLTRHEATETTGFLVGGAGHEQPYSNPSWNAKPSFYGHYGVPIKGASTTDFSKSTMPKNFHQPLTCFYWSTYGHCSKLDSECVYAHYHTGVVAAAPVSLRGKQGAMAGRNAMSQLDEFGQREKGLKDWEARLAAKEMALNGRPTTTHKLDHTLAVVGRIYEAIEAAAATTSRARVALGRSRQKVAASISESEANALAAIDAAIDAMTVAEQEFSTTEKEMELS